MFDIGVFLRSLTCEHYFLGFPKSVGKRTFSDSLLGIRSLLMPQKIVERFFYGLNKGNTGVPVQELIGKFD
jgi:hypothetical protein